MTFSSRTETWPLHTNQSDILPTTRRSRMKFTPDLLFGTLLPLLFATLLLDAQTLTTGNVTGILNDPTGAVVPGAAVTITYAATTETRSTASDRQAAIGSRKQQVRGEQ